MTTEAHPTSNLIVRLRKASETEDPFYDRPDLAREICDDAVVEIERLEQRIAFLEGMGPHPFMPTSLPPQRGLCHECGLERSARMHICRPDDHLYAAKAGSPIGEGVCIKCGAQEPADETEKRDG